MPAIDPDDLPKKKITHEMGQELALLSVGELAERIALLKDEIARLEAEMKRKNATKSAADIPATLMIAKATREPQARNLVARKNAKNSPPRPAAGSADRATTVTCPPKQ